MSYCDKRLRSRHVIDYNIATVRVHFLLVESERSLDHVVGITVIMDNSPFKLQCGYHVAIHGQLYQEHILASRKELAMVPLVLNYLLDQLQCLILERVVLVAKLDDLHAELVQKRVDPPELYCSCESRVQRAFDAFAFI